MNPVQISCTRVLRSWLIIAALCAAVPVSAQEFRGAITGRVTDTSKARLPGATVTATNIATNVATTSNLNRGCVASQIGHPMSGLRTSRRSY